MSSLGRTRKKLFIGSLLLTGMLVSCSKYHGCDPEADCLSQRPERGEVRIRITPQDPGDTVHVHLKEGDWKEGKSLERLRITEKERSLSLPVKHRYSAEASYIDGADTLRAYDSGPLHLKESLNCDEPCFQVKELVMDLERAD